MAPVVARMNQQSQVLPPLPQQLNPNNIVAPLLQQEYQIYQQMQPKAPASGVKGFLQNFLTGMGGSMMAESGLTPPSVQRQQQYNKVATLMQLYDGEEARAGMQRYRDVLASKMEEDTAFERQMRPYQLERFPFPSK